MIDVFSALLLVGLVLPGIHLRKEQTNGAVLTAQDSSVLKGLFCIGILLHHFSSFLPHLGPVHYLFSHVGKTIVGGFFFLSGYGLMKAYGERHLRVRFLLQRYGKLMIPYWLCLALYAAASVFSVPEGTAFDLRSILFSVVPIRSMVFGSWYIGATLLLYLLFYFGVRFREKLNPFFVVVLGLVLFSFFYHEWSPFYFAFPFGMAAAKYETGFYTFIRRFFWGWIPGMFLLVVGGGLVKQYGGNSDNDVLFFTGNLMMCLAFPALVYGLMTRIRIGNSALRFLGKNSYEIYMLHWLAMSAIYKLNKELHPVLFLIGSIAFTLLMAVPIHWLGGKLISTLFPKKKEEAVLIQQTEKKEPLE